MYTKLSLKLQYITLQACKKQIKTNLQLHDYIKELQITLLLHHFN